MNRLRIQSIAAAQIMEGRYSEDREVLIKSDSFAFKEVKFSEKIRQSPYYFRLTRQWTSAMEEVMGDSARFSKVEWDQIKDTRDRDLYVMRVSDASASTSVAFTPGEMELDRLVRGRLYRLWGDLLQDRSHRELQELLTGSLEGSDAQQ